MGSGMRVRPLCWLQTPLYCIALGTIRWWGSLIEIKSLLEPSFYLKKSHINPQKHCHSDEKVAAFSQIAALLILGPW